MSKIVLPEGVIDFQENIPPKETMLLAPVANLIAKKDFHPALVDLFLETASNIHGGGDLLTEPGQFPSMHYLSFPLNKDARRYLKSGPPFLQRYLPFWAASLIERLKFIIIPLITLLFPLFKIFPPTYRWRIRSRIFRWYKELQHVEEKLQRESHAENIELCERRLNKIEREVALLSVPISYVDQLYTLT
ncbi:MAG: hypothetical protein GKR87_10520 [Kiritimatiellae bacterium]|nr:hypothetical protein [Kiritimatiellia bacterium]